MEQKSSSAAAAAVIDGWCCCVNVFCRCRHRLKALRSAWASSTRAGGGAPCKAAGGGAISDEMLIQGDSELPA